MAAGASNLGMTDLEAQLAERRAAALMEKELQVLSEASETIALTLQEKGYFVIVRPPHRLYRPGESGAHYAFEIVFSDPKSKAPNMIGLDLVTMDHLVELVKTKVPRAASIDILIPTNFQMGPALQKKQRSRR